MGWSRLFLEEGAPKLMKRCSDTQIREMPIIMGGRGGTIPIRLTTTRKLGKCHLLVKM